MDNPVSPPPSDLPEASRPPTMTPAAPAKPFTLLTGSLAAALSVLLLFTSSRWHFPGGLTETMATITAALGVWFAVKEHLWNWPVGIVSSGLYVWVYGQARLYSDMGLAVLYVVSGFLGWYWWKHGGARKAELPVTRLSGIGWVMTLIFIGLWTIGSTLLLSKTHDSAPFLDSLTTAISLAAQLMITRKILENWHLWIVADIIYIGLYISKHLYATTALYTLFIVMCFVGLKDWKRSLRERAA